MQAMNTVATLTGRAYYPLKVAGVEYKVYPLTLTEFGDWEAWGQAQFPDPFVEAGRAFELFPSMGMQKHLLDSAMELASRPKPKLGMPELDAVLHSLDGLRELLYLSIRKGDPGITRATMQTIAEALTVGQLSAVFAATNAEMVTGGGSDPKGPDGTV